MNTGLLNREYKLPADGWYHLVPLGEHPITRVVNGRREEWVQVVDAEAARAICDRFAAEMQDPRFPGLLVDFDHFSESSDKPSEAAGWVTALEEREDGVWGQVRWSDVGEAAVKGGRYRLVSPVWLARDVVEIGPRRVRPLRLHKVALTNDPNMKGLEPLSNRAGGEDDLRQAAGAAGAGSDNDNIQQRKNMQNVAKRLGLSAEASEESVLEAVTQLMNRAETAERAGELEQRVKQLEKENAALLGAQVEQDLAKYADRIRPAAREGWKAALMANRAQALELLEGIVPAPASDALLNRAHARPPQPGLGRNPAAEQAEKILNRAKAIQGACPAMTWDDAWNQAVLEVTKRS